MASWEDSERRKRAMTSKAVVIQSPIQAGHERDYGGTWYVGLADTAIALGRDGEDLAREIARRWNANRTPPPSNND